MIDDDSILFGDIIFFIYNAKIDFLWNYYRGHYYCYN